MKKLIVSLVLIFGAFTAFASDVTWLGPTGLFSIYDATTLPGGGFAGSLYFRNIDREFDTYDDENMSIDYSYLTLPLAYGLTDRLELSVAPQYLSVRSEMRDDPDGMGDVYVNLKANLFLEKDVWGLAAVAYGKIPTADEDEGLGTGEADYGLTLAASKFFSRGGLHLNAGYRFIGEPDGVEFDDQVVYGLGMNAALTDSLDLIAELTGETAYADYMDDQLDLTVGARFGFESGMCLGGGVTYAFGMDDSNCPVGGFFQVGIKLGKAKPTPKATPVPTPPPVPSVECSSVSSDIFVGETTRMTATATDPMGSPLTYKWTTTGCKIEPNGSEAVFSAKGCKPGTYTVTVLVQNDKGYNDSCTMSVMVSEKPAPKVPVRLELPVVPFKKGTRVDNVAKAILDDIAVQIKKYPGVKVTLMGYSDSVGSEKENIKIGMQRAENVKKYLVERHAIESDRLMVESGGETNPIGDNNTADGRKMNRRVEVIMMVVK